MRTYHDGCSSAHALDLVGERWALLIVRDLLFGPKRFSDLHKGLPHGSPNVLTQRLRELESAGIVRRRKLPPPASTMVYELTEWGAELEPVLLGLQRWGAQSPSMPQDVAVGCDAAMLALKNTFDPDAPNGPSRAEVEVRFDAGTFAVRVDDGAIDIRLSLGSIASRMLNLGFPEESHHTADRFGIVHERNGAKRLEGQVIIAHLCGQMSQL
jgi:DNA-binding HxlR family transcriptional regulator